VDQFGFGEHAPPGISDLGPLTRESYASPAFDTTNLPREQAQRNRRVLTTRSYTFAALSCCHITDLSDTVPYQASSFQLGQVVKKGNIGMWPEASAAN